MVESKVVTKTIDDRVGDKESIGEKYDCGTRVVLRGNNYVIEKWGWS